LLNIVDNENEKYVDICNHIVWKYCINVCNITNNASLKMFKSRNMTKSAYRNINKILTSIKWDANIKLYVYLNKPSI
jgi:hypothetical protein